MARRVPWRIIVVALVALVAVLAVLGLLRTLNEPKGLTEAQYVAMVGSGSLAGVANTVTSEPAGPDVNLDQQRAAYGGIPACTTYWTTAQGHLFSRASAVAVNSADSLVTGIDTELWRDRYTAATSLTQWATCLQRFQEASKGTMATLKVTSQGVEGDVTWQYSQNNSADTPLHLLVLTCRNVVATFQLTDAPEPDWRDQLAERFSAQVAKAASA